MEKIMRGNGNMEPSKLRHRMEGMIDREKIGGGGWLVFILTQLQTEACAKMIGLFPALGSVVNIN